MVGFKDRKKIKLLKLIVQLAPVEIFGLAKILKIKLYDNDKNIVINGEELIEEITNKFFQIKRKPRRELWNMLKQATKEAKEIEKLEKGEENETKTDTKEC